MDDNDSIHYEVESSGIALITLNRPERLNAMNRGMANELIAALDKADLDPDVRVIILTGAGKTFCVGADLSAGADAFTPFQAESGQASYGRDWGGVLVLRIFELTKPIIAAVNGVAAGVGATMTLPCDIRIASTNARFGFVFAKRGIVTDGCASWFLPRLVGISTALRWCFTGEILEANVALEERLVSSLHEPDDLLSVARSLAQEFTMSTSALAVSLTRQILWHGLTESHPMGSHRLESRIIAGITPTSDVEEGVTSFLEKREAHFQSVVPDDLPAEWPFWDKAEF